MYNLNKKKVIENTEFLRDKNARIAIQLAKGAQPDDGTDEAEVIIFGYDQAEFFIRGLFSKGKNFTGSAKESNYKPVQTPLRFERVANGGYQNDAFILIHYLPNQKLEAINY